MHRLQQERPQVLAEYLIATRGTVRSIAKHFGISKSTAHKDVTERLKELDRTLYDSAQKILQQNKSERHVRGGVATKEKYERLRAEKGKRSKKRGFPKRSCGKK